MFFIGFILYNKLPSMIPMHWNIWGQVDNYMPKSKSLWIFPTVSLIMLVLFKVIPSFDPKKDKYRLFKHEWEIMQSGIIIFFAYLYFIILYVSLNPGAAIIQLIFIGIGALFILLGNYLSKIRQNYFIGIKIPWTLSSENNWNKTHRYASWCFVIAGIITIAESYFIWYAPVVIFASIFLTLALPIIYSFLLFKKIPEKMKYVYIILFLGILFILFIRLISGEDDWICVGGQWVKHGMPSAQIPTTPCK